MFDPAVDFLIRLQWSVSISFNHDVSKGFIIIQIIFGNLTKLIMGTYKYWIKWLIFQVFCTIKLVSNNIFLI